MVTPAPIGITVRGELTPLVTPLLPFTRGPRGESAQAGATGPRDGAAMSFPARPGLHPQTRQPRSQEGRPAVTHSAASHILEVPGASLYYEVRGSGPVLMLIGLPADSGAFGAVAPLLADEYTVVTYDPRGFSRSTISDPEQDATPELIADDVHRVLAAVTADPAQVFGSSGGAVTGLALVTRYPGQVRTLIAHEPPVIAILPDAAQLTAAMSDVYDTYRREGPGPAFAKFMTLAGFAPPTGDAAPEPAGQQAPSRQDLANGERMLAHQLRPTAFYRPDIAGLAAASARVVIGGGQDSAGQLAHRAAVALARQLGTPLAEFPGGHTGFASEPEPFAHALRQALVA
jgi:pimeloyl-ACP methyl ester carboxylesterase